MKLNDTWDLLKTTFSEWRQERTSLLAGALAYYTVFSVASLLSLAVVVAGQILGQAAAKEQLVGQLQGLVSPQALRGVEAVLASVRQPGSGVTLFGIAALLFGATRVFTQLQKGLNMIWDVSQPRDGIVSVLLTRLVSFVMVLGFVLLLIVFLLLDISFATFQNALADRLPALASTWGLRIANFALSFLIFTGLFGLIYKFLPDTRVEWGDVWVGAALTALLFTTGQFLIGVYIRMSRWGSGYGAASAVLVLLIWIYLSAQILLFGATFTEVFAKRQGSRMGGRAGQRGARDEPRQARQREAPGEGI